MSEIHLSAQHEVLQDQATAWTEISLWRRNTMAWRWLNLFLIFSYRTVDHLFWNFIRGKGGFWRRKIPRTKYTRAREHIHILMISWVRLAGLIKLYTPPETHAESHGTAHFFFWSTRARWIPHSLRWSARSREMELILRSSGSCRKSHIWKAYPSAKKKFLQGGVKNRPLCAQA